MEDNFSKEIEKLANTLSLFSGKLEGIIEGAKDKVSPEEYERLQKEHKTGVVDELKKLNKIDLAELNNLQSKL